MRKFKDQAIDEPTIDSDLHGVRRGIAFPFILTEQMRYISKAVIDNDENLYVKAVAHLCDTVESYKDTIFLDALQKLEERKKELLTKVHPEDANFYEPQIEWDHAKNLYRILMQLFSRKNLTPPQRGAQEL